MQNQHLELVIDAFNNLTGGQKVFAEDRLTIYRRKQALVEVLRGVQEVQQDIVEEYGEDGSLPNPNNLDEDEITPEVEEGWEQFVDLMETEVRTEDLPDPLPWSVVENLNVGDSFDVLMAFDLIETPE